MDRDQQNLAKADNFKVPFAEIDLAISRWGDPQHPLVLLVHGWGGHCAQLAAFAPPLLEAGYQVVSFDAPAHGDSPGSQTHGFEIAEAMKTVLAEVDQPYAIIAHSLGTMATNVALQENPQPEKIILTGPLRRLSDALESFIQMHDLNEEDIEAIKQNVVERFGEDVWDRTSLDKQLPKLDIPALILQDRQDEVTPYLSGVAIAHAWKTARLFTTEGPGTSPHSTIRRGDQ